MIIENNKAIILMIFVKGKMAAAHGHMINGIKSTVGGSYSKRASHGWVSSGGR